MGFALTILTLLKISPQETRADYINLTGAENARNIAEILVENDRVRVRLEVFVQDLDKFVDLIPDDFFEGSEIEPPPVSEVSEPRMRTRRESPFAGMINPYTRQRIPGPPEDPRVLYAEIVYPFERRPHVLEFFPPFDEQGRPAASIGFVTYHRGVTVNDFRFLSEKATLRLDWEDPWYSSFEQKPYKRWQAEGVRIFFYMEPYEVRYEILARVKDLEAWIDLGLRGSEYIEEDEFEPLKTRIGEFFMENERVLIDGKEIRPILDRVSFVKYTLTRTIFITRPERMPIETALVGVIITYLTDGIPKEVTVDWNHFSHRVQKVPTNAVDPAGPFPSYVTPEDRTFTWTNYLKKYEIPTVAAIEVDRDLTTMYLPAGTLLCALMLLSVGWKAAFRRKSGQPIRPYLGFAAALVAAGILLFPLARVPIARPAALAPEVDDEQGRAILQELLKNIYRAFDFREEEDVYDRLALSASGELLEEIYLQNRRSFAVARAGGAQARVKEVEIREVEVNEVDDNPLGLLFRAEWTATGEVGHWGHVHIRQNEYRADITVEPVDGSWKVTALELLDEKRVDPLARPALSPESKP